MARETSEVMLICNGQLADYDSISSLQEGKVWKDCLLDECSLTNHDSILLVLGVSRTDEKLRQNDLAGRCTRRLASENDG